MALLACVKMLYAAVYRSLRLIVCSVVEVGIVYYPAVPNTSTRENNCRLVLLQISKETFFTSVGMVLTNGMPRPQT